VQPESDFDDSCDTFLCEADIINGRMKTIYAHSARTE
jgi:hypothetical protein